VWLRRPPLALPLCQETTGCFLPAGTLHSLVEYLTSPMPAASPAACLLLDAPGTGKTVIVEAAAEAAGAIFARFLGSNRTMHAAQKHIERELRAAAARTGGLVDPALAEAIGVSARRLARAACLDSCREGLQLRGRRVRLAESHRVSFQVDTSARSAEAPVAEAREALLRAVAAGAEAGRWAADAPILLHFDEIQVLLADGQPLLGQRRLPVASSPALCMRHVRLAVRRTA